MKIQLSNKLKQMASALLVVMILGGILCMYVMYYLALVQQQNTLSVRSQAWNIAIAVSEAGIEEGLQALNQGRTPGAPITLSSTEWSYDGTYYWRTNQQESLGGNWYIVRINLGTPDIPEVVARAYVMLPALAANTPSTFFAVAGGNLANPYIVSRAVRVRCQDKGLFLAALVAKHKIDLKGNGILTDSFDSHNLWKSFFGKYDATVYAGDKGDVASNDGVVGTIGVGNAEIYGKAHTGPEGTVTINQGWVGSHPKLSPGGSLDGWILQDANFTFPETSLPYSSGLTLGGPEDIVMVSHSYNATLTTSTSYPTTPPSSAVITNVIGQTTNTVPWCTTWLPEPGTYVEPVTKIGSFYYYSHITGYTPIYSYTYNLYSTNTIYTTNHYDHVLRDGDYYSTDDLHGSTIALGNARLVLPNGLTMGGNDGITVATTGSLKMYVGGTSCTIGGNGIANKAGYAENFILECTDTVTTFNYNGNGEFTGVLVGPNADINMNGAGNANYNFIGSVMMNSVTLNGHFSFHYDESLSALKNNPRLLITSWDEIP